MGDWQIYTGWGTKPPPEKTLTWICQNPWLAPIRWLFESIQNLSLGSIFRGHTRTWYSPLNIHVRGPPGMPVPPFSFNLHPHPGYSSMQIELPHYVVPILLPYKCWLNYEQYRTVWCAWVGPSQCWSEYGLVSPAVSPSPQGQSPSPSPSPSPSGQSPSPSGVSPSPLDQSPSPSPSPLDQSPSPSPSPSPSDQSQSPSPRVQQKSEWVRTWVRTRSGLMSPTVEKCFISTL